MRSIKVLRCGVLGLFGMAAVSVCPKSASASIGAVSFTAEADAISGTYQCPGRSTQTISPVDQSMTTVDGSSNVPASSATLRACGKEIYRFSNIDDLTDASHSSTADFGEGVATTGEGSLLDGMVTWTASSDDLRSDDVGDFVDHSDVVCTDYTTITGLAIGGAPVAAGSYAPGTEFRITDLQIPSSSCLGVELFTGTLTLLEAVTTGNHTSTAETDVTTLHLRGSSRCVGVPLGVTRYDLKVGGPQNFYSEDSFFASKIINIETIPYTLDLLQK